LRYNLRTFYSSEQVKKDKMGRTLACMREKRRTHRTFVGKPERKKTLGIPGCRWEDNIKIGIKEMISEYGMV
jgi:hypothetical protein